MYYTGIGSRSTPPDTLGLMTMIAIELARQGRVLRSGGAVGADTCFEAGCYIGGGGFEIFYPDHYEIPHPNDNGKKPILYVGYDAPNIVSQARNIAKAHHPRWEFLNPAVQKLMIRNVFVVLGITMREPSKFVLCWTPDGKDSGGTGHTIRVARSYDIPVYNLCIPSEEEKARKWLKKEC